MLYHHAPPQMATNLLITIDLCAQACYWKRRFMIRWRNMGVDAAYADFTEHAPKVNPEFIPKIETLIEELKTQWRSNPSRR